MKKKLLFLGALALSSLSAFAQWTLPEVKGSDFVPGDTCYLYNKEAGAFLRGLGEGSSPHWGSRAGVSTEGVDPIIIDYALSDRVTPGKEASGAYDIPWLEEWDGETYIIRNYASHITSPRWDEIWFGLMDYVTIWVDRDANRDNNVNFFWNIEKNDKGTYYISISKKSTFLADVDLYGSLTTIDPETGEVTAAPVIVGGEKLGVDLANADLVTCFEGYNEGAALAYEWIFVSKEDYEAIDFEGFSRYYEAISLKNLIEESKAAYPSVDFSAAEAVYNNTASTLAELQAAKEAVKKAILDFQAGEATPDNPKDMTAAITNPTFDEIGKFDGWGGSGFGAGGTTSTCAERFNMNFNTYQDLQNLPMGIYKVGVKGFYRAGGTDNDWNTKDDPTFRHAKLYARSGEDSLYTAIPSLASTASEVSLGAGQEVQFSGYYLPNSMADFTIYKEAGQIKEVTVFVPVNDNKLRIGVAKETHITDDWTIVDDFTLTYYGDSDGAYTLWRDEFLTTVPAIDAIIGDEGLYNETYKTEAEAAVSACENATSKQDIITSVKNVSPAIEALSANVAAYAAYVAEVQRVEDYFAEHSDLAGDSVDYITDYLQDETEPGEYYPNGGAIYIKENAPLTTEEILAETEHVKRWFQAGVKYGLAPGSDCTNMLINPGFDNGKDGWTLGSGCNPAFSWGVVEVFGSSHGVVDIYQEVVDVPAGIYSISVQAFERPAANGSYDGTEEPKVFLYMNDFETSVQNIVTDALPEDQAVDRENCLLSNDYMFTSSDGSISGYVPNGMEGASIAFAAGRYYQKCYGIVGEDGVMKIGLTSHGVVPHWVLWDDFKLIYEGANEDAIAAILESTIANVNEYMNNHSGEMNALAINSLGEALGNAEEALTEDYDTMYGALTALNAAQAAAKEHVAAYAALTNAQILMEEAANIYTETASIEALEAYAAATVKLEDVDNMTTEEIIALTDECNYVTAALKLPSTVSEATDENPVDLTTMIVNADFIEGAEVGWSYTKNGGNGPKYDNGYSGPGFEFWNGTVTNLAFDIYQTLSALPEGKYTLAADLANSYNGQTPGTTGGRGVLYATVIVGTDSTTYSVAVEPQTEDCTAKWNNYQVTFDVPAKAKVIVGTKSSGVMDARWYMGDTFTLTYYGAQSAKENSGDFTGIESVESVEVISSTYYTLGGAKVSVPVKGINIVKSVLSNGKVKVQKVFVK